MGGLAKWANVSPADLQSTATYGPRLYRNGSILHQHLDVWETHVLSAVVVIGKRGMQQPWPMQMVSQDGTRHEIDDQPGDVIFYESAITPHSRDASKLRGREVANLFAHFRPKDWAVKKDSPLDRALKKLAERQGT